MTAKTKIAEMEEQMAVIQKKIEQLKEVAAVENGAAIVDRFKERLEPAVQEVKNILLEMTNEGLQGVSQLVSVCDFHGKSVNISTYSTDSLIELDEERLAAALDVFTNPRRISIIKTLITADRSASEIAQATGLHGGQLYHHLSILENAGLIKKEGDKFKTLNSADTLLLGLCGVISGTVLAK